MSEALLWCCSGTKVYRRADGISPDGDPAWTGLDFGGGLQIRFRLRADVNRSADDENDQSCQDAHGRRRHRRLRADGPADEPSEDTNAGDAESQNHQREDDGESLRRPKARLRE